MTVVFRAVPNAADVVEQIAQPGLRPAARAIASAVPRFVPVVRGVVRRSYVLTIDERGDSIRVHVGSPFWHWLEYGTRFNPAYRPVQNAVLSLGLRYEAASR